MTSGSGASTNSKVVWMIAVAAMIAFSVPGHGRSSVAARTGVVMQAVSFGSVVPVGLGRPAIVAMPFRMSIPSAMVARGYRLSAVSNFVFTPSAPAGGGKSITASDVGVGIAGISSGLGSRADMAIAAGFDYDPASAQGTNRSTAYAGAAAGRANLADLLAGREVLRAGRISGGSLGNGNADLTLTVKLAVQPQFLTPGGFSGTITLTAAEAQ